MAAWVALRLLLGLAAIAAVGHQQGKSLGWLLTMADGDWHISVAVAGYDHGLHDVGQSRDQSNLAFAPLLPALVRGVMVTGLSPDASGILIATMAGLAAAAAIYLFWAELHGPRTGILLTACWGASPHAVVLFMVYTEALFSALVALFLVAVLRRHG
jgi:Gpi18-like mannosyltransferase